ncbi:histidine kinase [Mucilaginibacter daejeonensis]|uniref:ligand-binding sensor domain-containing protein n=1 Tax=Mucilaginibacter daejeonensis TaxID=398049 RepID=UPI001D17A75E|nr:two-component regulator propeller domain-containing protein [Mucilaginibacter daejeonensis]UEG51847.1 histidine kinase [Mucilaginibacter daejeonensis]
MMKYARLYLLLLISVFCLCCGQNKIKPHQDHINYTIKDTVTAYGPSRMVRNIKQSKNGTLLIAASFGGVFSYDGKSFTNLTSKIGSRRYWNVLEDRRRHLWFATTDSGVYQYNGKIFRHFTTREGLPSNCIFSIVEDKAGHIWLGTGNGVSRYDGRSFQNLTTKDGLSNHSVHTIFEDRTGKLWFGTDGDACVYDGKTFTVFKNKEGKPFHNVGSIIQDRKGNIWFGASIIEDRKGDTLLVSGGLWRYDGSTFTKVSKRGASAIAEDSKGNIWTTGASSTNGVGNWVLARYDAKSLYDNIPKVTEIMSVRKMLCDILEVNDGSIWFGSMNGVYRYDGQTITDFRSKEHQK